ncbi:hypothetical protein [Hungatella hathewayi]|uniref:hypothetical protein n=1 Tax=Hungatella hathewayi TaxID=154046 RepID=UPI003561372A
MYENWKRNNKKMIMLMILTLAIGAALFIIFCLDLFSFAQLLAKGSSITSEDMKLYGEIFSAIILILSSAALRCKIKEDPEKIFVKSLRRYTNTTQQPDATVERLKKTWESGEQLRDWCRMDEKYIIECINGPCYANVIPIQEVVWAHKTVTQENAVIKTNGKTLLKRGYGGSQRICPSAAYGHTRRLIWFASSKVKELYLNRKKSPH